MFLAIILCLSIILQGQVVECSISKTLCIQQTSNGCSKCDYYYNNLTSNISQKVEDNTYIGFCSSKIELFGIVHITDKFNLSLYGLQGHDTVVHCQYTGINGSGFMFTNITHLRMAYTTFHGCSVLNNGLSINVEESLMPFLTGIYVYHSFNIEMFHIKIIDGNGTGLAIIDTTGLVNISSCVFKNNQGCRQWGAWGGFSPPSF